VIARGSIPVCDAEGTLAGRVQQFQVRERASASGPEWDERLNDPSILFDDELSASRAVAVLLLPESFWEAALLQPCQHPRAFTLCEVGIPSRIEWVGIRYDSDMSDDPSV